MKQPLAILALAALISSASQAQAPAAPPARPLATRAPPPAPYGAPITFEQAETVMAAARAQARRIGWNGVIAIVEPTGVLVDYVKMDGVQYGSVDMAQAKARTSALFHQATKVWQDLAASGRPPAIPGLIALEGGVPILVDGKQVGAIGASGGASAEDGVVANAGAAALK